METKSQSLKLAQEMEKSNVFAIPTMNQSLQFLKIENTKSCGKVMNET